MSRNDDELERARAELIAEVVELGQPAELGELLAAGLGTAKSMDRLTGYLRRARPKTPEPMVDEMLAITQLRDAWRDRKIAEDANAKITRFYNLPRDEEGGLL